MGPTLSRGTYNAIADVKPERTYVVVPNTVGFEVKEGVEVIGLKEVLKQVM